MLTNSEYSIRESRTLPEGGIVTGVVRRLGDEALAAYRRSRQRARLWHELQALDERQLRDVGLTRAELEAEAAKPFWRR